MPNLAAPHNTARISQRPVPELTLRLHENELVHRVLAARGVSHPSEISLSLADLPRPDDLPDIDTAIKRLLVARSQGEQILVIGDYDCDGATSTAVAVLGLSMLGFQNVKYMIPNRFTQGYGLSPSIVMQAHSEWQPHLMLTVDNGVASVDGVQKARELGIDVVVTDHHLPPDELPDAVAIVNPNLSGSTFAGGSLAGVGVMFYTLIALRKALAALDEPVAKAPLATLLDLVAIGTIADVVPLDAVNRTLVEQGIRRIRRGHTRPGVLALLREASRPYSELSTQDIGFGIGPRLNAAGRLDDMCVGVECLLTDSESDAAILAKSLNSLNVERRRIEKEMRDSAAEQLVSTAVDKLIDDTLFTVCLMQEDWHQGVIGILAGRVKDSLHKPVVAFAGDGEDLLKGSARSIAGIHIRDVLQNIAVRSPGMIDKFGGHAMAAGLTLPRHQYDAFRHAFEQEVCRVCDGQHAEREFLTDGPLDPAEQTLGNAELLARVMPWGQKFEAPVFSGRFAIVNQRAVGQGHLKLMLKSAEVPGSPAIDAIAFNCALQLEVDERVLVVYSLEVNTWRERRSVQLRVHHIEQAGLG